MSIPRRFHFVFGLREQSEAFHLLHYLCLASCIAVNKPESIQFHYRHEPWGELWDRIRPMLTMRPIASGPSAFRPERYEDTQEGRMIRNLGIDYAHEADFLRLDILAEEGGIYADMDTLFVQRYPEAWLDSDFVIGEEYSPLAPGEPMRPSLCNAVLLSRPESAFLSAWRQGMARAFDGRWNTHSCREAGRLWHQMPEAVRVLPSAYFYRYGSTPEGIRTLLEERDCPPADLYSVHLWAHLWWSAERRDMTDVHAGMIDGEWIRKSNSTLANLARSFLPDGPATDHRAG
ncbi:MAG: glycosyltransferase [Wenzhouxiangella sp.]